MINTEGAAQPIGLDTGSFRAKCPAQYIRIGFVEPKTTSRVNQKVGKNMKQLKLQLILL